MKNRFITTKSLFSGMVHAALLLAAVLVTGCAKDDSANGSDQGNTSREIRIATLIDQADEQTSTKAVVGDQAALTGVRFLVRHSAPPASTMASCSSFFGSRASGQVGAVTWTTSANAAAGDVDKPKYAPSNDNAYIKALWPGIGSGVTATTSSVTWAIDGKTDILASDIWDAGMHTAPKTGTGTDETPISFHHALAQLAVICKAEAVAEEIVTQDTWGSITKIELMASSPSVTYTYDTDAITPSGTAGARALVAADYTANFTTTTLTKNETNIITAVGMFAPAAANNTNKITLKVYTTKVPAGQTIDVQLNDGADNRGFEAGKSHTVTLTFQAKSKQISFTSTIEEWKAGYTADNSTEF